MAALPIYTTEPMVTRALGAEIRHDPQRFVELLRRLTGLEGVNGIPVVRCEGAELIDVELTFGPSGAPLTVGIEAKLDHALTKAQVDRQLEQLAHVVVLVPADEDVPDWVHEHSRLSGMTWAEALSCFTGSRLTVEDIASIPLQKRQIERRFQQLPLVRQPPLGWFVSIERNGAGLPAVLVTSPKLPDGRELRAQLQVVGRGMSKEAGTVRFEYFLGISIGEEEAEFPDPDVVDTPPKWIASLTCLRDEVIGNQGETLLIDQSNPRAGKSIYGPRKIGLIKRFAPESIWLAKGYRDWALGAKSKKVDLGRLDDVSSTLSKLALDWFAAEEARQQRLRIEEP